ncbi:hypothetical protein BFF78_11715 [Streptomyces fodineus]|uniref:Uncharacterized protein n=1 Tax=Streptomyces fodineus TaxID=1904616 RepID=A0A1D7Y7M4_9ACTN|nr:hypothetical protein [Streptomyces fodineus]AOR31628.1 hypothetical protein BFF78_11715 [Streptomyces fodineus]
MKPMKRIALAVSSVAVAGVAVVGAGGTVSAAPLASTHVQRQTEGGEAADYSWDHGVGYLLEQGYSCDAIHGWHQDHHTDSPRHDCDGLFYRDGHFYRWEGEGHGWKSDRSYRHDGYRFEHDGRGRDHHDLSRDDR